MRFVNSKMTSEDPAWSFFIKSHRADNTGKVKPVVDEAFGSVVLWPSLLFLYRVWTCVLKPISHILTRRDKSFYCVHSVQMQQFRHLWLHFRPNAHNRYKFTWNCFIIKASLLVVTCHLTMKKSLASQGIQDIVCWSGNTTEGPNLTRI